MPWAVDPSIFPDTTRGRRRNALFDVTASAALLAFLGAVSALTASLGNWGTALALGIAGLVAADLAILVARGKAPRLTADEQLFWRLGPASYRLTPTG